MRDSRWLPTQPRLRESRLPCTASRILQRTKAIQHFPSRLSLSVFSRLATLDLHRVKKGPRLRVQAGQSFFPRNETAQHLPLRIMDDCFFPDGPEKGLDWIV